VKTVQVESPTQIVEISVTELARAFWNMDTEEQAEFLDQLGAIIEEDGKHNRSAYSYGEMQWCHLRDELRKPGRERANIMHMALSAFAYDFVPQKIEGCRS